MTLEVPALAAGFASKFDTIGPYVGFASLIAVVAMAVLLFAQGRELQRLREWAGTSPERLEALEEEIRARAFGGAPPQAQTRPGTLARHPGVPVGAVAAAPGGPGVPPPPPGMAGAPGAPVVGASTTTDDEAVPGASRPGTPRPVPPGAPGAGPPTRILSAAGAPRAATPAGQAASTARERGGSGPGDEGPKRSVGAIVGGALVLVVVVGALLFAFGVIGGDGGGSKRASTGADGSGGGATTTKKPQSPKYSRTATKVTVLNGSGTSGVAKTVSDAIEEKLRFPMGEPSNYTVNGAGQNVTTTTVQYSSSGSRAKNRAAALDIAESLGLKKVAVRAITDTVKAGAPDAKVVVVVGSDIATKYAPAGGSGSGSGTSGAATGDAAPSSGASSGTSGGAAAGAASTPAAAPSAVDPGGDATTDGTSGGTAAGTSGGVSGATTP